MRIFWFSVYCFFAGLLCVLQAQTVSGYVFNQEGEALAGVNIYLIDSNIGTVTNGQGYYHFKAKSGYQELIFSYMGYRNDTLKVNLSPGQNLRLNQKLKEQVVSGQAIYVFASQYNDAQEIVYKTIENKQKYLSQIQNYSYEAYHKTIFRVPLKKGVPIIGGLLETKSRGFYRRPDRFQEVVLARRQSKNFSELTNVLALGRIPNLLEETLTFDEVSVLSPLSNKALSYYRYEMIDTTFYNNHMVFNIRFMPADSGLPLFSGRMSIIDGDFAVIYCVLKGGASIKTVLRDSLRLTQRFRRFNSNLWFPVELKLKSRINMDIPGMPYLYWNQHALISGYKINDDNFEHRFDERALRYKLVADSLAEHIWAGQQTIALDSEEEQALKRIDSLVSNAGFIDKTALWIMRNFNTFPVTGFYDFFHFNRVQGYFAGVGLDSRRRWNDRRLWLRAGYGFADRKPILDAQWQQDWWGGRMQTRLRYKDRTDFVDRFYRYNPTDITTQSLLNQNDYADYLHELGGEAELVWRLKSDLQLGITTEQSRQSRKHNRDGTIRSFKQRAEFPVQEGLFRTAELWLQWDNLKYFDYGWLVAPDMSQDFFDVQLRSLLGSNAENKSFNRYYVYASIFRKWPPWFNLYARLNGGWLAGDVPAQYLFHIPGAYGSFANPVLMRTLTTDRFAGDRYLLIALENNFRNAVFGLLGIPYLKTSKIDLLVFTNAAWMRTQDIGGEFMAMDLDKHPLVEGGLALGNLFTFLRLDFTWRFTHRSAQNFRINLTSRLFIR